MPNYQDKRYVEELIAEHKRLANQLSDLHIASMKSRRSLCDKIDELESAVDNLRKSPEQLVRDAVEEAIREAKASV